jgi:hypothetical protein
LVPSALAASICTGWSKRDDIHLSQRGQLRQWRIGTLFASASQQQLQQLGLPVGTGQDSAHSDAANLAKLKLGRVDLIAMLDWAMHWQLQQAGLPERTVKPAALLDGGQYWYALNPQTPDDTVNRLQTALDDLENGYAQRLRQNTSAGKTSRPVLPTSARRAPGEFPADLHIGVDGASQVLRLSPTAVSPCATAVPVALMPPLRLTPVAVTAAPSSSTTFLLPGATHHKPWCACYGGNPTDCAHVALPYRFTCLYAQRHACKFTLCRVKTVGHFFTFSYLVF